MEKLSDLIKHWREISISLSHRPIGILLLLIIGWILCFYDPPDDNGPPDQSGVNLVAVVDALSGSGEDVTLTVKDLRWPDGRAGDECLCVYPAKSYSDREKKCSFSQIKIGQTIQIYGDVRSFRKPGNPGQFNEAAYYHSQGIIARMYASEVSIVRDHVDHVAMFLHDVRGFFRDVFYQALPEKEAGVLTAMVLGDKSGLSEEVNDLYRENGLAHILAISGLHISLIGVGLFELLRKTILPVNISTVVTGILLFLYGQLTGFSLPTRRAVIMTILVMLARVLGERYDSINAISLAAVVELVCHPSSLYQSGFLLSYGTVVGIVLFVHGWEEYHAKNKGVSFLFDILSGSMGISLVTLPILIQSYHEIAIYSVLVNALLLPAMSLLLGLGIIGGIAFMIDGLFRGLFGMVYAILCGYQQICEWVVMLPGNTKIVGNRAFLSIVFYYLVLFSGLLLKRKKALQLMLYLLNCIVLILPVTTDSFFPAFGRGEVTITNLDVGQGDCSCIIFEDGRCVLIDGGSSDVKKVGRYRIVPFLKYYGIDTIDYMIITHSDADHVSGLEEILEKEGNFGLTIGHVVMPQIQNKDENYSVFEKLVPGGPIYIKAGDQIRIGGGAFTCLHPAEGYRWEDANDYSTVLEFEYGHFKALFTGDLGFHGEEAMKEEMARLQRDIPDVDYLKVGHHGSKTSSSETFLSKIKPEIAVASAGENNRYHHPSKEAVERLEKAGAKFYCTIEGGAITTRTDGESIKVSEFID